MLWIGIALLFVSILLTLLGYAIYSGLFVEITTEAGKPKVSEFTFAYKFERGPYKDCGSLFTEACSLDTKLKTVGVFYDDPCQVTFRQ